MKCLSLSVLIFFMICSYTLISANANTLAKPWTEYKKDSSNKNHLKTSEDAKAFENTNENFSASFFAKLLLALGHSRDKKAIIEETKISCPNQKVLNHVFEEGKGFMLKKFTETKHMLKLLDHISDACPKVLHSNRYTLSKISKAMSFLLSKKANENILAKIISKNVLEKVNDLRVSSEKADKKHDLNQEKENLGKLAKAIAEAVNDLGKLKEIK